MVGPGYEPTDVPTDRHEGEPMFKLKFKPINEPNCEPMDELEHQPMDVLTDRPEVESMFKPEF